MKSLLSKTLVQFALCTTVIFALTTPLFYLLTRQYYAEEMIDIIQAFEQGRGLPPLDLEEDIMIGMMIQFLLIFLVVSLSLFITIRFITHHIWQPFDDTLRKAERFNLAQDNPPKFSPTDIIEFTRLNNSLEQLMLKDREKFRIQKEFTENASHELQTPLAIIRSKLDLLMQENLTERQMCLVSDLYGLTMRMRHLNRNLLLLAKIDNAQYATTEEVDIAALIAESLPLYDVVVNDGTSTRVDDRRSNRNVPLQANSVLLECLLKNLIVNAIRHSSEGSVVYIIIEDKRLIVSNASIDGKALDTTTLFQRFRNSNTVRQKGNGLGLAIVKAICSLHSWTVEYSFHDGKHNFTVEFTA